MTVAKIRDLSKFGVLADVDPYNLPPQAFSMAVNARFADGSVERGPVFRRVPQTLSQTNPRFLSNNTPTSGFDSIIIGYLNGRVTSYKSGTETDLSVSGYVNANSETAFTSCHLADVFYVNRSDRVPWSLKVTDAVFQNLLNWDGTWRAKILRSCSSALCAFGITKGATVFPTMIKTSEFAQVNTVPTTWDNTLPTNNATENTLAEMEGGITDAQNLGEIMIVYGLRETWKMIADGSSAVWSYHKLFSDAGAVNVNCSVEVDQQHYVFGLNDIWKHDGNSKTSIIDGQNRKFVFSSINASKFNRCFVKYDERRKQVRFYYVSGDAYVAFSGAEGCNRCAIYDIPTSTWTFEDEPFIFGATEANLDNSLTWASVSSTWAAMGSAWLDQDDGSKKTLVAIGDANATYSLSLSLYAVDDVGPNSAVGYPVDANATRGSQLYREGIDLDELPEVVDNRGYKVVSSIYPEARLEVGAQALSFTFGSNDHYNQPVIYGDPQTFDANVDIRCDYNTGGRYLAMKMTQVNNDYHWFRLTGIDFDLYVTGQE